MNLKSDAGNWWSRECGVYQLLASGLPLAISTATFAVMHFCDRLFLTWYDPESIGAVLQAGALSWTSSAFFFGLALYGIAFVSQYRGSGQLDRIGAVIWHSCAMVLLALPLFAFMGIWAEDLFRAFDHPEELIANEAIYFRIMTFGMPAMVMSMGLNAFFVGLERTRVLMLLDIGAALLNVVLDYAWIFGALGFPEWGLEGAGWATVVSLWVKLAGYIGLILLQPDRASFGFGSGWKPDFGLFWRLIRFGGPNGLQFVLEGGAITVVLLYLGEAGALALDATTLAFSVNMVAFVPVLGLGMAVTSMVGNQIGRQRPDLAVRATWSGVYIATAYSLGFVVLYVFTPHWFLMFHELDGEEHAELLSWTLVLLRFVGVYCLFDAWQVIFASAIKGAGDTWFTVVTLALSSALVVIVGASFRGYFETIGGQILWWWSWLTLWLMILAAAFFFRFLQGAWKKMTVIGLPTQSTEDAAA